MTATTASTPASATPVARLPFPFLCRLRLRLLARWYDRHLQRLDLGLTREDVRREYEKPLADMIGQAIA